MIGEQLHKVCPLCSSMSLYRYDEHVICLHCKEGWTRLEAEQDGILKPEKQVFLIEHEGKMCSITRDEFLRAPRVLREKVLSDMANNPKVVEHYTEIMLNESEEK